jgi:nitroreductase
MNDVMTIIKERRTDRSPHSSERHLADTVLSSILEAARWAPTAHNMQNFEILVVDDPVTLDRVGAIRRELSADFLRENYLQLSFSEEELRRRRTGVLARTFPPSWQRPDADVAAIEPGTFRDLLQGSPTLLLVLHDPTVRAPGSEGDFLGVMSLGCVMQNMWLTAQSFGIGMQILSAFGAPAAQRELRPLLRLPTNRAIAFACRLGVSRAPDPPQLRIRRDVRDFVYRNTYGEPLGPLLQT